MESVLSLTEQLAEAEAKAERLRRQIAAASCAEVGHRWKHIGGKNCGCNGIDADGGRWSGSCSVPVYECAVCKDCDYGDNAEARDWIAACAAMDHDHEGLADIAAEERGQ